MVNPNICINLTQNNFSELFHIFSVKSTTVDLLWTKTMSGKYSTMGAAFSEFPPSWLFNEARAGDVGFNISDFNTNLKVKKIIFTSRRRLADISIGCEVPKGWQSWQNLVRMGSRLDQGAILILRIETFRDRDEQRQTLRCGAHRVKPYK